MDGIISVYKPQSYTSFDVVAVMRKLFRERKVGHGGTLDPIAEGVLPVFMGGATKAVDFQPRDDKEYLAGFRFGITTDTQDITGKVLASSSDYVSRNKVIIAERYIGEQEQIPPMYSAVQVNGKRLYELARKGEEVERKPRKITIHNLKIEKYENNEGIMRIHCSAGTYIRTLIHDIGQEIGTGAVMTSLVRTRSGVFTLEDCYQIDELKEASFTQGAASMQKFLRPVGELFVGYPRALLTPEQTRLVKCGVILDADRVRFEDLGKTEIYAVYSFDMVLLGLAKTERDGSLTFIQRFPPPKDELI